MLCFYQLIQSLQFVNETIEKVVRLQDGGLNNSLDTMTDVVREYSKGQDEIQNLRKSLNETQKVLTAKKTGQTSLRELWLRKVELQESIRMVRDIEELKVFDISSKQTKTLQFVIFRPTHLYRIYHTKLIG